MQNDLKENIYIRQFDYIPTYNKISFSYFTKTIFLNVNKSYFTQINCVARNTAN